MMACYDELTLGIASDGELPEGERRRLVAHLDECPACRRLLATLEAEAASLRSAFGEAAMEPPPLPRLGWALWSVGLGAACVGTALTLTGLAPSALPTPLTWLHPADSHLAVSLGSRLALHLFEEGVPTMPSNAAVVAAVVALALLALGRTILKPAALAAALLLLLASPAQATVTRVAEHGAIVIGADETVDDSLVAVGDSVVVEGLVKGDLIALAREVRVKGKVTGSLASLAKHLELDGQVDGDVYAAQESLSVGGRVGRNVHAAAQRIVIHGAGSVAHDLRAAAEEARIDGTIGGGLTIYASWAELAGRVGGTALLRGERAAVRDSARVGGDLTVTVPTKGAAEVAAGAAITGTTQVREEPWKAHWRQHEMNRLSRPGFYVWQLLWLVAALVTGALLYSIAPGAFDPASTPAAALKSMGVGFIVLFVTPIAAIVAGVTVIGLPVGLITLAAWGAALFVAPVFTSAWLGTLILRRPTLDLRALLLALLVGQLILRVVRPLPFLGGFVSFIALILGLGLATAAVAAGIRRLRAA